MEFIEMIFTTIIGSVLGVIIFIIFMLYWLTHFLNFIMEGLRIVKTFILLCVLFAILGGLEMLMPNDDSDERAYSEEEMYFGEISRNDINELTYSEDETYTSNVIEVDFDLFMGQFLSAYEANDERTVEKYFLDGTAIESDHVSYMISQAERGMSLSLQHYELQSVVPLTSTTFEATTYEAFEVAKQDGSYSYVEQYVVYTLVYVDGRLHISEMVVDVQ